MCVYGYCWVSTRQQSIDRQIRNIKGSYDEAVIIQEIYTGTGQDRPEWDKLYKKVKTGDIIVFDSVLRMSRNADEGFCLYEKLFNKGIELVFLKEPHINTSTYKNALESNILMTRTNAEFVLESVNKYLTSLAKEQIRLAIEQSEKEAKELHQKTKEGIETARLNGKQIGQKQGAKLTTKKSIKAKKQIQEQSRDFNGTLSDADCMKLTGLARNTFYKYKRELKSE